MGFRSLPGGLLLPAIVPPVIVGFIWGHALRARDLQQVPGLCSQQVLVCSSHFSVGEKKILSAVDHIVAPLFIAVYSFCWNHPQGKFMCTVILILSV